MGISKVFSEAKARITSVSRKRLTVIAACVVIAVMVIVIVGIRGCAGENASGDGDATCSTSVATQPSQEGSADSATGTNATNSNQNPDVADPTVASGNDTDKGGDLSSPTTTSSSAPDASSGGQSPDASTGSSASDGSSSGSVTDSGNAGDTAPSKIWVIDYTQVWVEDSPSWTEQVPVYGYEEHSICNVCNADITGTDVAAHAKAHMLAGEGGGHHTEMVQVITGYETEYHEATGHYETVESGGHWE